jgi:hypothetical protein
MPKLLVAVLLAAATAAVVRHGGHHQTSNLAFDRLWIDHVPRGERDPIEIFVANDAEAVGEFVTTTRWAGKFEGFRFEAEGDELRAVFPQTGARERMTIRAKACDQRGFDYCLVIEGSGHGTQRYYSQKDWVIERSADVDARVKAILAP